MKFFLNQNIALVVWLILAALVFTACGGGEEIAPTEQPEPVETAVPEIIEEPTMEPTVTPGAGPTVVPTAEPTNTLEKTEMEPTNKPEVVSSFDAARSELPEGTAIDNEGNIYVSLAPPLFVRGGFGEIWKISPDGTTTTLAQFEGCPPAAGPAVLRVDVGDPTIIWKLAFGHDSTRLAAGYNSGEDVGGQVVIWQLPGPDADPAAESEINLQFEHNTG
jgi:hypothetical protein